MATTEKLSVTLDHDDAAWARQRARKRKISFSAVLSDTVRQAREFEAREKFLRWALAEQPLLTAEELEAAERELVGPDVNRELARRGAASSGNLSPKPARDSLSDLGDATVRKTPRKAAAKRRTGR